MMKLREDLFYIFKGIGVLHKMTPYNLLAKIMRSFCDAALPFCNLYFSSLIVNSLISKNPLKTVCLYIAITVVANALLTICSKYLDNINYIKWNGFYLRYNYSLGEKLMALEYSRVEDPKTHIAIKQIEDAMKIGNYGLIKIHSRIPILFQHLFELIFSIVLVANVIFTKGQLNISLLTDFSNSIYADISLVILMVIIAAVTICSNNKIASEQYKLLGNLSQINRTSDFYLNQYLDGHKAGKDIRLYRQHKLINDEFRSFFKKSQVVVNKITNISVNYNLLMQISTLFLVLYAYSYVSLKAMSGAFLVGSILKYTGAILSFSGAFSGMADAFSQLCANTEYLKKYFSFAELPEEQSTGNLPIPGTKNHTIEFKNVSFKYPRNDTYILKNLSFSFNTGEKIAVVGKNGSGKTTMIKLLCRLYKPTSGEIFLDGKNIFEYDHDEYMGMFGVVFQDFKLFSFSLGENISGKSGFDVRKLNSIAKKVGLSERIDKMPQEYNTNLYKDFDDSGVEISGGEAQKIALARALYKDSTSFLILDEPTSALDPIAEAEIYQSFSQITEDRGAIFISHRLSSTRFCDKILVFKNGVIVQQGNHDALLKDTQQEYYKLWQSQAQYYSES